MAVATWLDPAEPEEERRRQVARIEEFVTFAVTRQTIDRILDAVG